MEYAYSAQWAMELAVVRWRVEDAPHPVDTPRDLIQDRMPILAYVKVHCFAKFWIGFPQLSHKHRIRCLNTGAVSVCLAGLASGATAHVRPELDAMARLR